MQYFKISDCLAFFIEVFVFTLLFRAIFSYARAYEYKFHISNDSTTKTKIDTKKDAFSNLPIIKRFSIIYCGFSQKEPFPDLWYNTIIGTFELFIFPILMYQNLFLAIGAWMTFKTVGQWDMWKENRLTFNRFLIANILQIITSYHLTIYVS